MIERRKDNLPIDRGWAWVILGALMVIKFIEAGLSKSFGVFFVEYEDKFESSASMTSLVAGLYCGTFSFTSLPLMALGLKKISCRMSVVIGGFFLFIGYLVSSLAETIAVLIIGQSIFTGLGFAFIHGPSLVVLGRYFKIRRGMANGIASAFSSFGGLLFPLVLRALLFEYSLAGALLITSGLVFNTSVAGSFLRPLEFYTVRQKRIEEKDEDKSMLHNDENNEEERVIDSERKYSSLNNLNSALKRKSPMEDRRLASLNGLSDSTTAKHFSRSLGLGINLLAYSSIDLSTADNALRTENCDSPTRKGKCSNIRHQISSFLQIFDASFVSLLIAVAFGQIPCGIGYVYISPYARDKGIAKSDIPILVSVVGAGNLCSRIVVGLIADMKHVRKYMLIAISLTLTGTMMFFVTFFSSFVDFVVLCILYGMFSGCLTALYAPVCVEMIGLDKFNKGMGILTSAQGLMLGLAAPLLGLIRDTTGSYVLTFYVMGTISIFAGLSLICVPCAKRCTLLKQNDDAN